MTKRASGITDSVKYVPPAGYTKINVLSWHSKDTPYYTLSPFFLKTDDGIIFENYWQGSKVYPYVYPIQVYPHYSMKGNAKYLQWEWTTTEKHILELETKTDSQELIDKVTILPEYYTWRQSIFDCRHPIRYPNGRGDKYASTCAFALNILTKQRLTYIPARKEIYVKEYARLARATKEYPEILDMFRSGKSLCIIEVDVPDNTVLNMDKLKALLEDPSKAFGHGLVLAMCLFEDA